MGQEVGNLARYSFVAVLLHLVGLGPPSYYLVVHLGAFGDLVDQFLFLAQCEADDRQVFGLPGPDGLPVGRSMASRKHVLYIDRQLYAPVHGPSVDGLDSVAVGREHDDWLDQ